jgi:hypothetical protein
VGGVLVRRPSCRLSPGLRVDANWLALNAAANMVASHAASERKGGAPVEYLALRFKTLDQ